MLSGAQALGEKIKVDAGRDLSISSLQDTDDYHSWQKDSSAGASFTFGSMTGSASLSMSQTKIDSEYASVGDQSGLFAGDKGFDINVGKHTQLNGGVIASTADSIKNQLSTGTLGWDAIDNKAEYKASSSGFGLSTGGPTGGGLAKEKGKASGTTQSAIAAGNIDIRDTANETQDVAELSRDTDNANGRIDKIFDEAKVKDNLAFTQGVTQLATQLVSDYGNKQMLQAQRAAAETLSKDPAYLSASPEQRQQMLEASPEYKAAQEAYGVGSNFWAAGTAISAALAGLSGGDIGAAAGGALAPYLAKEIKSRTEGNTAANAAAHAVAGALVALVSGNNVAVGAAGAASGELAAKIISEQYYGKAPSALTEAEKQNVSALSQLASGLAGGLIADSTAGAVSGNVAGKTAVENNFLSSKDVLNLHKELEEADKTGADKQDIYEKYADVSKKNREEAVAEGCSGNPFCANGALSEASAGSDIANSLKRLPLFSDLSSDDLAQLDRFVLAENEGSARAIYQAMPDYVKVALNGKEAVEAIGLGAAVGGKALAALGVIGKAGKQPYEPNQGSVGNMSEFLKQPGFGSQIKNTTQKSSQQYQGQSVYKATGDIGEYIKKGDQFYLDGQHKNHLEVFDKRGDFRAVLNLDGSINQAKTEAAKGREL
ncbi:VENN motif pre-toxin domain-containing protein [Serratia plymuthica]|uniref:VENN motif pre-toxin domain-containing protein n=1 Tax=Serratia plymuthica TaxID=82996 RepID=UPI0007E93126|nr:VENN motif pre-toxin domain-containing protein [Serratia plymuthica]